MICSQELGVLPFIASLLWHGGCACIARQINHYYLCQRAVLGPKLFSLTMMTHHSFGSCFTAYRKGLALRLPPSCCSIHPFLLLMPPILHKYCTDRVLWHAIRWSAWQCHATSRHWLRGSFCSWQGGLYFVVSNKLGVKGRQQHGGTADSRMSSMESLASWHCYSSALACHALLCRVVCWWQVRLPADCSPTLR